MISFSLQPVELNFGVNLNCGDVQCIFERLHLTSLNKVICPLPIKNRFGGLRLAGFCPSISHAFVSEPYLLHGLAEFIIASHDYYPPTKSEGYSFGLSLYSVHPSHFFVRPEPYLSTKWSDLMHIWYK